MSLTCPTTRCIAFPLQCSTCWIKDDIVQHVCSVWTEITGWGLFLCRGALSCGCCCTEIMMDVTTGISRSACQQNGAAAVCVVWRREHVAVWGKNAAFAFFRTTTTTWGLIDQTEKKKTKKNILKANFTLQFVSKFSFWYGHNKYL